MKTFNIFMTEIEVGDTFTHPVSFNNCTINHIYAGGITYDEEIPETDSNGLVIGTDHYEKGDMDFNTLRDCLGIEVRHLTYNGRIVA